MLFGKLLQKMQWMLPWSVEADQILSKENSNAGEVERDDAAKLYINGSSNFMYNSAQRHGGAFLLQQSEVRISDNSSFTMNSAILRGGGMCLLTNSIAYVRDSVFSDNWCCKNNCGFQWHVRSASQMHHPSFFWSAHRNLSMSIIVAGRL